MKIIFTLLIIGYVFSDIHVCREKLCNNCQLCVFDANIKTNCCDYVLTDTNLTTCYVPLNCNGGYHGLSHRDALQDFKNFFTVTNIILVCVGAFAVIFVFYSCCIFGKRYPPMNYTDIKWKKPLN